MFQPLLVDVDTELFVARSSEHVFDVEHHGVKRGIAAPVIDGVVDDPVNRDDDARFASHVLGRPRVSAGMFRPDPYRISRFEFVAQGFQRDGRPL